MWGLLRYEYDLTFLCLMDKIVLQICFHCVTKGIFILSEKKITPNWFFVNILHILLHALLHYFNINFESIIVRKCSEKCAENVLLNSFCHSSVFNFTRVSQVQSVFDNEGKLMWTSEGSYKLLKSENRDKVKLISSPLHAKAPQRSPLQFTVTDGWRMWTWALSETRLIEFHTFQI